MSTNEELEQVLDVLNKAVDIDASAVVSRDGKLKDAKIPPSLHPEVFGAMSVTMPVAAKTAVEELKKGLTDLIIVQTKEAKIIVREDGPTAPLVAMTSPKGMLGFILLEMERTLGKIKALV